MLLVTNAVYAQSDEKRAVVLFDEGRRLAREGRCGDAIPLLLESLRFAEGVGPLLNLGNCYEVLGRTASAHRYFLLAAQAAAARADARREEATSRARNLEPDLSYLVVTIPSEMSTSSVEVWLDAEVLPRERWGLPLPVDLGPHTIEVLSPPHAPQTAVREVKQKGERVEWKATVPSSQVLATPLSPVPVPRSREGAAEPKRASLQKTLGLITGSFGLAGLGVGAVSGTVALSSHGSAVDLCPGYPVCPSSDRPRLDELNGRAETAGTVSTIGFAAGAVLLVGGLALFLTAPTTAER